MNQQENNFLKNLMEIGADMAQKSKIKEICQVIKKRANY